MTINFPVPVDVDALFADSAPIRVMDAFVSTDQNGEPKKNRDGQTEFRLAGYFKRSGRRRGELLEIKLFGTDPTPLIGHSVIPVGLTLTPYTLDNGQHGDFLVADDFEVVDSAPTGAYSAGASVSEDSGEASAADGEEDPQF